MNYSEDKATTFLTQYAQSVASSLIHTDFGVLARIAGLILATKESGKRVYTVGNGGSAATASHMCNDLMKGARVHGRVGFRAVCLNDSTPIVTCLANDFAYEDIFSIQLLTYAEPGDLLVVFSGSGNSSNIVKALKTARKIGVTTIGLGGRDGGEMKCFCDEILLAPTDVMEQLEDMHMLYVHAIVSLMQVVLPEIFDIETCVFPSIGHNFKIAFFDFYGTITTLRCDWQDRMDLILEKAVVDKLDDLPSGRKNVTDILIPGTLDFLKLLRKNNVLLGLVGGTDEERLKEECKQLGLTEYFDQGIFSECEDGELCGKEQIIKRLLKKNNLTGENLIGFGDSGVDIEVIKSVGGYAVGLATNEKERRGINEQKRKFLLEAGADAIIPDFSDPERLWRFIGA